MRDSENAMLIFKLVFAFFACCAIGTGIALVEQNTKNIATQVYVWLIAIIMFIALGVVL